VIYVDTSVVVPMFVREPGSAAVLAWLESASDALASSDWIVTEFASALSIKVRGREIAPRQARDVLRDFDVFCRGGLSLASVSRTASREAAKLAGDLGRQLRTADALHLAMAREMGVSAIATADAALVRGAEGVGLAVIRF
jgi:predicted nucleic acid-binding protein